MFVQVEGGTCILRKAGVYRQSKVCTHNGYVFAGYGSGFIMLLEKFRGTTVPDVLVEELSLPPGFTTKADGTGRLKAVEGNGHG